MPSRVMQQKLLKLQKSRRKAYLKKPRSGGVDSGKIVSYELFQNKSRVTTTIGKSHEMLPNLENTWTKTVPDTISRPENAFTIIEKEKSYYDWNNKGELKKHYEKVPTYDKSHMSKLHDAREAVKAETLHLLDKLRLTWQGSRQQGVSVFNTITLAGGGDSSLKAYFSGNEWLFVIEDKTSRSVSRLYKAEEAREIVNEYNLKGKSRISWKFSLTK